MALRNEKELVNFLAIKPTQTFAVRGKGYPQVWNFNFAAYADVAAFKAAFKTGVEALPAYSGRTITPSGTFALTDGTNGALVVDFDGQVDVPELEFLSGPVQRALIVGGDTGNYSFNGGATFTLPITESQLQTNQRALGGSSAQVLVRGTSVAANNGDISVGKTPIYSSDGNNFGGTGAFDRNYGTNWGGNENSNTGLPYIGVDLGLSNTSPVTSYGFQTWSSGVSTGWVLEGSNNNSTWTAIDSRSGQTSLAFDTTYTYYTANTTVYRYVRLRYTEGVGFPQLREVYFYDSSKVAPASASFKFQYPIGVTPPTPAATGTGATNAAFAGEGISGDVVVTTLIGGGLDGVNLNAITANGTSTVVDVGASVSTTNTGYQLYLQCLNSGFNSSGITVKFEHSDNGTTGWSDLATFARVASRGSQLIDSPSASTSVKRYVRASWTVDGTAPLFVIAASLSRRSLQL